MWFELPCPSPCFVLDLARFSDNLRVMRRVRDAAGVTVLLALKGFAMHGVFPLMRDTVAGVTASSLNEALLGVREFGSAVHAYAPAFLESEWDELAACCSHVTFNSLSQFERYGPRSGSASCGLRINPEFSDVEVDLYNPCVPGSRLGVSAAALGSGMPAGLEGLHAHNLCESTAAALESTVASIERLFGHLLPNVRWLNLGGGHLVTRAGYDVDRAIGVLRGFRDRYASMELILEPGAAFAWDAGVLVSTVQDVVESGGVRTAILDVSFAAHMPDCLEMPYRPAVDIADNAGADACEYRLGGCSCLAGDWVGPYTFRRDLDVGDRVVFQDMMHYTMVKTTMFNGINLPAIGLRHEDGRFELVKTFGYDDYRNRLS